MAEIIQRTYKYWCRQGLGQSGWFFKIFVVIINDALFYIGKKVNNKLAHIHKELVKRQSPFRFIARIHSKNKCTTPSDNKTSQKENGEPKPN